MKKAVSEANTHGTADTSSFDTTFNIDGQNGQRSGQDAAAAAAIAAAKLNAMLVAQAKAASDSNPTAELSQTATGDNQDESGERTGSNTRGNGVVPIREGKERDEFVADIDINDIKHRHILTKGSTQTQVRYRYYNG